MNHLEGSQRQLLKDSWSDWGPFFLWVLRGICAVLIGGGVAFLGEWISQRTFGDEPAGFVGILGTSALEGFVMAVAGLVALPIVGLVRWRRRSLLRAALFCLVVGFGSRLVGEVCGRVMHWPGPLWVYAAALIALSVVGWCIVDKIPIGWLRGARSVWDHEQEPDDIEPGGEDGAPDHTRMKAR